MIFFLTFFPLVLGRYIFVFFLYAQGIFCTLKSVSACMPDLDVFINRPLILILNTLIPLISRAETQIPEGTVIIGMFVNRTRRYQF